jgi:Phycobilisome protein
LRNFSSFLQSPIIQSCEQESIGQLDLNLFQVKETLNALGVPLNIYIKTLQFMKENIAANLNNDAKILAVSTFDRTISDLSS